MRRSERNIGVRRAAIACAALMTGFTTTAVRAEFAVGARIPAFSLKTSDGKPVAVALASGAIQLTQDDDAEAPKVLAIHLLQPDCLQCRAQLKALQQMYQRYGEAGLAVLGISHRGDDKALADLERDLSITFPLLVGTGSGLAKQFAAGDTFALIDNQGVVRFTQVGYGAGDERVWEENIERMLAGALPAKEGIDRQRLKVGDPFPAIVLPSLRNGKPMELTGKDGKLVFQDEDGKETHPKGVLFFFSRY